MEYDTKMHLPQQIENMLSAIGAGDERLLAISLDNIKDLVGNSEFSKDLDEYEQKWKSRTKSIQEQALQMLQTHDNEKTFDDAVNTINKTLNDLNEVYGNYIKAIKTYVLEFTRQQDQIVQQQSKEETDNFTEI